jgi:3-methylcrotonyl-CoA carboxylase alpha subunit
LRVDTGVGQGDQISPFYDPMIAKLIVHGPDRATALSRLRLALGQCEIAGTVTNLSFLSALAADPDFIAGDVDTGLIARKLETLVAKPELPDAAIALAALTGLGLPSAPDIDPWGSLNGWRAWGDAAHAITLVHLGEHIIVRVGIDKAGYTIEARGRQFAIALAQYRDGVRLIMEGAVQRARVVGIGHVLHIFLDGRAHELTLVDPLEGEDSEAATSDSIASPMPGVVRSISANAGQCIGKGEALIVLEAMKMEYTMRAPRNGVVAEVRVAVGEQVDEGATLLTLQPKTA